MTGRVELLIRAGWLARCFDLSGKPELADLMRRCMGALS